MKKIISLSLLILIVFISTTAKPCAIDIDVNDKDITVTTKIVIWGNDQDYLDILEESLSEYLEEVYNPKFFARIYKCYNVTFVFDISTKLTPYLYQYNSDGTLDDSYFDEFMTDTEDQYNMIVLKIDSSNASTYLKYGLYDSANADRKFNKPAWASESQSLSATGTDWEDCLHYGNYEYLDKCGSAYGTMFCMDGPGLRPTCPDYSLPINKNKQYPVLGYTDPQNTNTSTCRSGGTMIMSSYGLFSSGVVSSGNGVNGVLAHEVGHAIGMNHNEHSEVGLEGTDSLMRASLSTNTLLFFENIHDALGGLGLECEWEASSEVLAQKGNDICFVIDGTDSPLIVNLEQTTNLDFNFYSIEKDLTGYGTLTLEDPVYLDDTGVEELLQVCETEVTHYEFTFNVGSIQSPTLKTNATENSQLIKLTALTTTLPNLNFDCDLYQWDGSDWLEIRNFDYDLDFMSDLFYAHMSDSGTITFGQDKPYDPIAISHTSDADYNSIFSYTPYTTSGSALFECTDSSYTTTTNELQITLDPLVIDSAEPK